MESSDRLLQVLEKAQALVPSPLELKTDWAFTARDAFTEEESRSVSDRLVAAGWQALAFPDANGSGRYSVQVLINF
jgi:hypothetical protein